MRILERSGTLRFLRHESIRWRMPERVFSDQLRNLAETVLDFQYSSHSLESCAIFCIISSVNARSVSELTLELSK